MADTDDIARSVARSLGDDGLVDKLGALLPSELNAVFLAVMRTQAARRTWRDVLVQADRDGPAGASVRRSAADARALHRVEGAFFDAASSFEAVELAPVQPLGLCARSGIDQNNVLSALRSLEVLADPTAALALEVARRRRRDRGEVLLCARARVLRMQPLPKDVPDAASFTQHFGLLCLVTGTSASGAPDAERSAVADHCGVWLRMLALLGVDASRVRVRVSSSTGAVADDDVAVIAARVACEVVADHEREKARAYYRGLMIAVDVRAEDGAWTCPGDGGAVPWTQELVADRKERLVTSGFGAEYVVKRLRLGMHARSAGSLG